MSFRDNLVARRFERDTPFGLARADYVERDRVRTLTHVETPAQARGQGVAAALMGDIVAHARAEGQKLLPLCSYAVAYFERHPEARDVLGER
jgi:predicted GNAT family acetyltransferase